MAAKKEIVESRLKKWEQEKRNAKPGDTLILDFSGMDSRFIPFIPEGVTKLNFANNKLNMIKSIPYFLTYINLSSNYITSIPSFPDKLETIILSKNDLTILPDLPKNLKYLQVNENRLTSLPKLPKKLEFLDVSSNNLKSLPDMPDILLNVNASTNSINSIGKISKNIVSLNLKSNNLKNLPIDLPDSLKNLDISYNKFETMPFIPSYTKMNISNNPLYINLRKLQPKYISTHRFSDSKESKEPKDSRSENLYKTVKIPKGTVLFHSAKRMEQFSELFVEHLKV
jgi:E3 ubiquitin-protein ligase SspH2